MATVLPGIKFIKEVETKLFGPAHAYEAKETGATDILTVLPAHKGPLLKGAGVAGTGFTCIVMVFEVKTLKDKQVPGAVSTKLI
jgi:hypothetical protein